MAIKPSLIWKRTNESGLKVKDRVCFAPVSITYIKLYM